MAVIFNVLARGVWKNIPIAVASKSYTYTTTTPVDNSPGPLQPVTRRSSLKPLRIYEYTNAIPEWGKIFFGTDGIAQYDFSDYARMPFKQPVNVIYSGRNGDQTLTLRRPFDDDNEDKPFSAFASKYSKTSGIFYGIASRTGMKIKDCRWHGISVAEKNAIPTLYQFDTSDLTNRAGRISTKNISFISAAEQRTISIYQNRVVDGNNTYWFDDDDHNAKVRFIYTVIMSEGGNGGMSLYTTWWVFPLIFPTAWISGSGGGAGGYSIDLVRIPDDGHLEITIPKAPAKIAAYIRNDLWGDPVIMKYQPTGHQSFELRRVRGGMYGKTCSVDWNGYPLNNRDVDGGWGGYIYDDNSTSRLNYSGNGLYIKNIAYAVGAKGADNNYSKLVGVNAEGNTEYIRNSSYPSEKITISGENKVIKTDGNISIPSIPGVTAHWDSSDTAEIPGGGGSSQMGKGGDFAPLSDGYAGEGPGAGGGGGAKQISHENLGGPGGTAFVCIGF